MWAHATGLDFVDLLRHAGRQLRLKSGRGRRLEIKRTGVIRRIPVRTTELRAALAVKAEKSQLLLTLGVPTPLGLALQLHAGRLNGCVRSRKGGKDRGRINGGAHLSSYTGHTELDTVVKLSSIFLRNVVLVSNCRRPLFYASHGLERSVSSLLASHSTGSSPWRVNIAGWTQGGNQTAFQGALRCDGRIS